MVPTIDCKKRWMTRLRFLPLKKSEGKSSQHCRCHLEKIMSFGARVCAVESCGGAGNQTPAKTDPINHNDTPLFYSIKILAKMKRITKMSNWTYIRVITTTLNDQNHISENCIGSAILSPIRLHGEGRVYDLYCSHPPGDEQRARSFTCEAHPVPTLKRKVQVIEQKSEGFTWSRDFQERWVCSTWSGTAQTDRCMTTNWDGQYFKNMY